MLWQAMKQVILKAEAAERDGNVNVALALCVQLTTTVKTRPLNPTGYPGYRPGMVGRF